MPTDLEVWCFNTPAAFWTGPTKKAPLNWTAWKPIWHGLVAMEVVVVLVMAMGWLSLRRLFGPCLLCYLIGVTEKNHFFPIYTTHQHVGHVHRSHEGRSLHKEGGLQVQVLYVSCSRLTKPQRRRPVIYLRSSTDGASCAAE